jgi:hypothetical protein
MNLGWLDPELMLTVGLDYRFHHICREQREDLPIFKR